jgi:hypothetical protein
MDRRDFLRLAGVSGLAAFDVPRFTAAAARLAQAAQMAIDARDPVAHVINRLTFGITPELYDYVSGLGVEGYIEEQLNPDYLDDSALESLIAERFPLVSRPGAALFQQEEPRRDVVGQVIGATLLRAVYSRRQLYERMVQFWGDHFYIYVAGAVQPYLKLDDDRDVIRPHAVATFRDLLGASAHSPAMLEYLDNAQSRAEHPNENYARELLELHLRALAREKATWL